MPNHFHLVVRIKKNVVYKYSKPETNANAVSSHEADRFEDVSNSADLSACGAPDNVKGEKKDTNRMAQLNADRSGDAVRLSKKDAAWFEEHKWETIDLANFRGAGKAKKPVPHHHFAHLFNSYTRYFNRRTGGTGNLFERPFKRKPIHNESYLKKVILYVHNNPIHHGFCNHLLEYPWSSYIACISEKPTKLNRKSVLNLFNERDGFKKQHNHKVDIKNIEKYLNLDEVDYTTKINDLNADISNDAIPEKGNRIQSLNTVSSNDADKLTNESTKTDLTASERPVNVKKEMKH
jgi:REP element-mobilizing transposase RayT